MYFILRHIHITCAALSILGFALRGAFLLAGSDLVRKRWIRRVTDANDAVLLSAAIGLVVTTGQYPFVVPWVTAKVIALLFYIGLGIFAFRVAQRPLSRFAGLAGALAVAAYIVSVAVSKNPWGFLAAT